MNKNLLLSIAETIKSFDRQVKAIENEILRKIDVGDGYTSRYIEKFLPVDIAKVIEALENNGKTFTIQGKDGNYIWDRELLSLEIPLEWLFIDDIEDLKNAAKEIVDIEVARKEASKKVKEAVDNLMKLTQAKENIKSPILIVKDKK